jgi:flagellar hook-basal body complex protein FliE
MVDFNIASVTSNASRMQPKSSPDNAQALDGESFGDWLNRSIGAVNTMQKDADTAARQLVSGENKDIHGAMIAMQKADIALNLMLEVRNKIISAYDEIKRMQF